MSDRILAETPYLRFIDRDGWAFVERPNATGVVMIVALTDDRRLILVEQPRPPLGTTVIELPAGLVGDEPGMADEPLAQAARRELLEETGYEAAVVEPLGAFATSPGMTPELVSLFRARGLRRVAAGGGVAGERIRVHEIPLDEAPAWLQTRAAGGTPISIKVFAGLYWAAR
jgi:ADP-ribose pyrophosphatase